jgi:hypothetical protein
MPEAEIAKAVQLLDVMLSGAPHPRGPKGHGLSSTILTVKMSGGILFQRSGQISIVARPLAFTPKSPETKRNGSRRFGPVSGYWRRSRSQQARRRLPVWPRAVPFNRVLPCRRAQYGSAPGSEFGNPRSQKQSESRKPPPGYGCSSSARDTRELAFDDPTHSGTDGSQDSPVEGSGFEPSVPVAKKSVLVPRQDLCPQWSRSSGPFAADDADEPVMANESRFLR